MSDPALNELLQRPGITPDELAASKLLPLSRNRIYEAIKRGEIANFRIGRKIIIPTAALKAKFQIA
jgi:excisionase family DNA binding protein